MGLFYRVTKQSALLMPERRREGLDLSIINEIFETWGRKEHQPFVFLP